MPVADLHLHSTASDGRLTPREVVQMAREKAIQVVALTDHDTSEGLGDFLTAGQESSLQVIPGIELSTELDDEEIHILGYYIQYTDPKLQDVLSELKQARIGRIRKITQRLNQLGFSISWDEVAEAAAGASSIGRPHVARVMVDKGYAPTISDVFSNWIGPGKPAFVRRYKLAPDQAISIIHAAGGLAFLAHPGLLTAGTTVIHDLASNGLDGIEVFHTDHSNAQCREFLSLARNEGLYISGGSDCHGIPGEIQMGRVTVDIDLIRPWLKD